MLLASPPPVYLGISTALANGTHEETDTVTALPLLPLPLITVRVPFRRFEFDAEGIPPIGPVSYRGAGPRSPQGTALSYLNATLRYRIAPHTYLGLGETLYNQRTPYLPETFSHTGPISCQGCPSGPVVHTATESEVDASRVPGMRIEALRRFTLPHAGRLTVELAITPSMHAIVHRTVSEAQTFTPAVPFSTSPFSYTSRSPETGSQVDGSVGLERQIGSYTLHYGVRYVNYVAHFDWTGSLADRNTLIMPFVGFERRIGR